MLPEDKNHQSFYLLFKQITEFLILKNCTKSIISPLLPKKFMQYLSSGGVKSYIWMFDCVGVSVPLLRVVHGSLHFILNEICRISGTRNSDLTLVFTSNSRILRLRTDKYTTKQFRTMMKSISFRIRSTWDCSQCCH